MLRLAAVFVAICMVLIAGSLAAVLYLFFGLSATEAGTIGLAALTGLALYNTVSSRLRDRSDVGEQIADLSRLTADLAKHMAEIKRNLAAAESKVDGAVNRVRSAVEPVTSEIDELGVLLKQLAETVAIHDAALARMTARPDASGTATVEPEAEADTAEVATEAGDYSAEASEAAVEASDAPASEPVSIAASEVAPVEVRPEVTVPAGEFKSLSTNGMVAAIREAIEAGRMDLYLQPVVTLPQRKVRFYEALTRLRMANGEQVTAEDFMPYAEAAGLLPKIDNLQVFRCVQILRRLLMKNRDVGLFCNLSATTLGDPQFFPQFSDFIEANRAIAPALVFEFKQEAYRGMGPLEFEGLASLASRGFRFSMDHVSDLRMEPRDLSEHGFRYLKVPGAMLLRGASVAAGDIDPADLSDLLARHHIDLIAERIESESTVVDLLDFDVRFGQGFLFSQPRPVRAEAMQVSGAGSGTDAAGRPSGSEPPPRMMSLNDPGVPRLASGFGVVA